MLVYDMGNSGDYDVHASNDEILCRMGLSYEEAEQIGERITNLQRIFNLRRGLTAADDMNIGERLLEDPGAGIGKGYPWGPHAKKMIKEPYRVMGWEEETGKPLPEALEKLGLESMVKDIW